MADEAPLLHHDGDLLSERRAAYRPRLRGDRDRRDRALQAARRLRRVLPHRHRRARHQDAADGDARGHHAAASSPTATCRASRHMAERAQLLERRLHPHHRAAPPPRLARRSGGGWRRNGDIYLDEVCRLVLGPRRGLLRRGRDAPSARRACAAGRRARRSSGSRRRAISSASPPIRRGCSTLYEAHPDFIAPKERRNEVVELRQGAACRISRSRAPPSTGASRCPERRHEHVMYVWVDALTNYITGVGFPDDDSAEVPALLAGRPARHRQGHRPLPRGLLAGLPDVGRHRAAEARLRARLPVQPRREDVEVGRQRRRPVRARRRLRRRPGALFLPARGAVRPGRQLQPRGDRQPHQRRPRQRPRQPGAALAVDDRQAARRRAADAGRVQRGRQGDARRGRRAWSARRARRWRRSSSTRCSTPIWAVVADANRYFAGEEPWALRKTDPARRAPCSTSPPR